MSLMSCISVCPRAKFDTSVCFYKTDVLAGKWPKNWGHFPVAQKLGPFSGPKIGGAKGEAALLTFTFCAVYFGPENGPIFLPAVRRAGPVSSDARRLASARVGRKALTLVLLTVCVGFVNFI